MPISVNSSRIVRPHDLVALVRWEEVSDPKSPALTAGLDMMTRTVHAVPSGVWALGDIERFFADMAVLNHFARQRFGPLKVLMDATGAFVIEAGLVPHFQAGNREVFSIEDRIAVIVTSVLFKMQIRRLFIAGTGDAFLSQEAAEEWLRIA